MSPTFLSLPTEVRNMIYGFCVDIDIRQPMQTTIEIQDGPFSVLLTERLQASVLRICRQIRQEVTTVLVAHCPLQVNWYEFTYSIEPLAPLPPEYLKAVTSAQVYVQDIISPPDLSYLLARIPNARTIKILLQNIHTGRLVPGKQLWTYHDIVTSDICSWIQIDLSIAYHALRGRHIEFPGKDFEIVAQYGPFEVLFHSPPQISIYSQEQDEAVRGCVLQASLSYCNEAERRIIRIAHTCEFWKFQYLLYKGLTVKKVLYDVDETVPLDIS